MWQELHVGAYELVKKKGTEKREIKRHLKMKQNETY